MSSKGNPQRRKQIKRRIPIGRPTSFHIPKTMYDRKKERQFGNKINTEGANMDEEIQDESTRFYWEFD